MSLEFGYRVLNHLTLGLACVCLVSAEWSLVPLLKWALPPALVLIIVAARVEGRFALQPMPANILGLAITLAATAWFFWDRDSGSLPILTSILPCLGPVLMSLMLVKLFRPREQRDFWLIQGLGLLQVCLGCVFSNTLLFGVLVGVYFLCGYACLALHYVSSQLQARELRTKAMPFRAAMTPFLARWGIVIALLSVILFLLVPRGRWQAWNPDQLFTNNKATPDNPNPTTIGFDQKIDLTVTGKIEATNDPAFVVRRRPLPGSSNRPIPTPLRLRGCVLDKYHGGNWTTVKAIPDWDSGRGAQGELPDLGPDAYLLDFDIQIRDARGIFLAEPISLPKDRRELLPVLRTAKTAEDQRPYFFRSIGTLVPGPGLLQKEYKYLQKVGKPLHQDRVPVVDLDELRPKFKKTPTPPDARDNATYVNDLRHLPPQPICDFAQTMLEQLVAAGKSGLTSMDAGPVSADLVPGNSFRVAKALNDYLASSGEFSYTLNIRSEDLSLDPVHDFLKNVRKGHCELYASALALLLRSRGIPARIVKGFRVDDDVTEANYIVRQNQAHSWVEAIVPSLDGSGYDWLTLDPTPGGGAAALSSSNPSGAENKHVDVWRELVVDYNGQRQADLVSVLTGNQGLRGWLQLLAWVTLILGLFGLGISAADWLKSSMPKRLHHARASSGLRSYARLLSLLERKGLIPTPGQTPRNMALAASILIRRHAEAAERFGTLPDRIVDYLYLVRFGKQARSPALEKELDEQVRLFAAAMR